MRIRGIYATALTNLLSRQGFRIVQPSRAICERFNLAPNQEPYDLDLYDLDDLQGVFISGEEEGLEQLIAALQRELPDAIARRFDLGLHAVYRGVARSSTSEGTVFDLGGMSALLPGEILAPGETALVQVAALPGRGQAPLLRRMIGIPGRYAVLISTGRIATSRQIEDYGERMRLSWLGAELAPKGWGIVWHTAAAGQSRAALAEDIDRLKELAAKLDCQEEGAPQLLLEGTRAAQLEFPGAAKRRLDELRNEVVPTLAGHHQAKAAGNKEETDLLEQMLRKFARPRAKGLIAAGPLGQDARPGEVLAIEHVKLDGQVLVLGHGTVTGLAREEGLVELEREIKAGGEYDGLGIPKEPGDRAVTEFTEGSWYYRTRYYSRTGELKGEYFNINTPIEVYPDRIRYVDLEIDVASLPGGEPRLLDEAKLEEALARGWITEGLAARAREVARSLLEGRSG
ncbi:MAG: DUF402 domain-containing protein [Candidatus Acetothermia bacterium]|nr:DUF402 domain-containing protein [Candidatus Acetothermia bacterium]MDH7505126.1 DUF402 domain-containing protein [Candidatus Acetothermia bacterium]